MISRNHFLIMNNVFRDTPEKSAPKVALTTVTESSQREADSGAKSRSRKEKIKATLKPGFLKDPSATFVWDLFTPTKDSQRSSTNLSRKKRHLMVKSCSKVFLH